MGVTQMPGHSERAAKRGIEFIDTDVHNDIGSLRDLEPYLANEWKRFVTDIGYGGPVVRSYALTPPAGAGMANAMPQDGSRLGSDLDLMREQLLDRYNVKAAILVGNFQPAVASTQPELQSALASAYNDWVIDNWLQKDSRFRGSICISSDPTAAAREIDRVGSHPQFVQVGLMVLPWEWGDPYYHPVFEAAQRHDLVIAMHACGSTRCAVPLPRYWISWHAGSPQAHMAQLIGLIFNGVFDKYPRTKVVLLEGGWTWLPHVIWRMDREWRSLRAEVPWVKRRPSEYVREHFWLSSQPLDEPEDPKQLLQLMDMIGTDEFLVFATDYPHYDFDDPERVMPHVFSEDLRAKIFMGNALNLYSAHMRR